MQKSCKNSWASEKQELIQRTDDEPLLAASINAADTVVTLEPWVPGLQRMSVIRSQYCTKHFTWTSSNRTRVRHPGFRSVSFGPWTVEFSFSDIELSYVTYIIGGFVLLADNVFDIPTMG